MDIPSFSIPVELIREETNNPNFAERRRAEERRRIIFIQRRKN